MYHYSHEPRYYHRRHKMGWPAILFGLLLLAFLAGPIFSLVGFVIKIAFGLLPFIIIGGLIAFGVRALVQGHGEWHQFRDEFQDRFKEESKRWKDYRYYRKSDSKEEDNTEVYHI